MSTERGFEATILRCGFFYGPGATHTRQWGRRLLSGALPVVGNGLLGRRTATLSFLHVDDAAGAFVAAIDGNATGLYHVVDDEPVTTTAFFSEFATLLDTSTPRHVPKWLARPFLGKTVVELLTTPTTNEKFGRETGWSPEYSTYEDGLRDVVKTWTEDGTIRSVEDGYEWSGVE